MVEEGYGSGFWGSSQYGLGTLPATAEPPRIVPLNPADGASGIAQLKPISFCLADDVGIDIATLRVVVNGLTWIIGGVEQNGASMTAILNDKNGYEVSIDPPAPYDIGSRQSVVVSIRDVELATIDIDYSFAVGVGPRLLNVRNPMEGLLIAHFNQPMLLDNTFFFIGNWNITPVSDGAAPLAVTEVVASASQPDVAHIRYTGGGSTYLLTTTGILGEDGSPVERGFETVEFEIDFGEEDQPTVRVFNSIFGPLGVSQRNKKRRTIDEFTANRAIALALDEQLRLRFQQLDNTAGRDGRNGKLRTI